MQPRQSTSPHTRFGRVGLLLAVGAVGALGTLSVAPSRAAGQTRPAAAEEVLAVVRHMFDGMREADSLKVRSVFAEGARFASVADRAGTQTIQYSTVDGFVASIARSGRRLDERLYDVEVRVDDNIAMVWAPYTLYQDGQVRHCGVDLIDFLRVGGQWKITQLADTRRMEGCRQVPPGPGER